MYVQYTLNPTTALHSLNQPGIVSIPLSFMTLVVVSLLTQKRATA
jgi:cation/acetate symporter